MDPEAIKTLETKALDAVASIFEHVRSLEENFRQSEKRIKELESRGGALPSNTTTPGTITETGDENSTDEPATYKCPHCRHKVYTSRKSLREHKEKEHVGKKCHYNECHFTSDEAKMRSHLEDHQSKAAKNADDPEADKRCHWPKCEKKKEPFSTPSSALRCFKTHNHKLNYSDQ
ncbi:hypothetical protein GGR57DRAFT_499516 [Xylariaceae sp. FL1272]|nr:hypothetical protein GGR57DRAFT_499516 [Xylariaceae sp. FL1272]